MGTKHFYYVALQPSAETREVTQHGMIAAPGNPSFN
jgi:hypothetical protein